MFLRIYIVVQYIFACARIGAKPWRFFQMNARYFDEQKGVFSKLTIEKSIPEKFRLKSYHLKEYESVDTWHNNIVKKFTFPVFIKPEWGQNSHGIVRVDSADQLKETLQKVRQSNVSYYCQEAASGNKEFDVYYIRSTQNPKQSATYSVTELTNPHTPQYPINGIYGGTVYTDITPQISTDDMQKIMKESLDIGSYNMARIAFKADNYQDIITGKAKIVEINIYTPMPINLMDTNLSWDNKRHFIVMFARHLAEMTKKLQHIPAKKIFWRKLQMHYKVKNA